MPRRVVWKGLVGPPWLPGTRNLYWGAPEGGGTSWPRWRKGCGTNSLGVRVSPLLVPSLQ